MADLRTSLPNSFRVVREGLKLVSEHSNETSLITETLARELNLQRKTYDQMLDIGCGFGRFSRAIGPSVQKFVLLEPDSVMLRSATRQIGTMGKPVESLCCRVEDVMDRDDWRFDLIMLSHVLYYTSDWRIVISRCLEWLTGTGRLVVVLWSRHSDLFRYAPKRTESDPEVTSETVLDHLEKLGVRISSVLIEPTISASSLSSRRTLVRFMGYSSPEEIERVAEIQMARTSDLIDRQHIIIVRQ